MIDRCSNVCTSGLVRRDRPRDRHRRSWFRFATVVLPSRFVGVVGPHVLLLSVSHVITGPPSSGPASPPPMALPSRGLSPVGRALAPQRRPEMLARAMHQIGRAHV